MELTTLNTYFDNDLLDTKFHCFEPGEKSPKGEVISTAGYPE